MAASDLRAVRASFRSMGWQRSAGSRRSRANRLIYEVTSEGSFSCGYALRDQIRRASVSIMSNIAEGFERGGDNEFRHFLATAKGSAGEVRSQLYVARDAGLIQEEQFAELMELAAQTGRLLSGFMAYLGHSELRGSKYR